jgi:flagellar biosynthesis/type III secretory pathway chaperone
MTDSNEELKQEIKLLKEKSILLKKEDKKEKCQKCETKQQEVVPSDHLKDMVELIKEIKKITSF